ncbi:Ig-like domain-containing protein [Hymenobacter sp. 5317J-9]|uniref:Ig-like domain-containing protein n=1 Tax=Hymenobacter sp. 5317J-9 TaxID=2932250 RepID=UPI001FD6FB68|nr:Ig-like domain-containing protein [Hymenobacter sp. 5317J-9]UOQ98275.1 Ig-like domain-containing protein [Hymenobacter sp. 5317J-9]
MTQPYPRAIYFAASILLLWPTARAWAQAPTVLSTTPAANAGAAPRNGPLVVSFSQPLTAGSAGALKVFSSQRGGLRSRGATPATVSGNGLRFAPQPYDFRPGETVRYTVTTAAQASTGALAQPWVGQFTTAVAGTGRGAFAAPATNAEPAVGIRPVSVAVGDLDGDGDLDLVTVDAGSNNLSLRFNDGTGRFLASPAGFDWLLSAMPSSVVLGDVNGDGLLDVLIANEADQTVAVLVGLGGGRLGASGSAYVPLGQGPGHLALGDIDGDGDLDFVTANFGTGSVSIGLNDGHGAFAVPATNGLVAAGARTRQVALGDVDGDGDLDLLATNESIGSGNQGTVSVRLNNGAGVFTAPATNADVVAGFGPHAIALGDVDGDGDLDAVITQYYNTTGIVLHNNGAGSFANVNPNVSFSLPAYPTSLALGDVDGDGDLDVVAAGELHGVASVRLNAGGAFTSPPPGGQPTLNGLNNSVVLGDVDGDGDLDLLATNRSTNTVSVRLNGGTGPLATVPAAAATLALYPSPAHDWVAVAGATPHAVLAVVDTLGRPLLLATADATGAAALVLPSGTPAGIYVVRAGTRTAKLLVE